MMSLRDDYLAALRQGQRQLVSKSALGPSIACLRDETGRVIGFGPVERVPPEEVARLLRIEVAKSAEVATDPNAVFDSLFGIGPEFHSIGAKREASKSADTNADPLEGVFCVGCKPRRAESRLNLQ